MIQIPVPTAVVLVLAFLGCIFAFGRILLGQFEKRIGERFTAQDATRKLELDAIRVKQSEEAIRVLGLIEKVDNLGLLLPLEYVRREDWIRFGSSIDHKQDRLYEMVMQLAGMLKNLGESRARD